MNLYFLVEGRRTEKKVYKAWTPLIFKNIRHQDQIDNLTGNDFYIASADGPMSIGFLMETCKNIQLIKHVDHLFVCLDAEQEPMDQQRDWLTKQLQEMKCPCQFSIIIANCCMETWFLGNQAIMTHQPAKESPVYQFKNHYDVSTQDPEAMSPPQNNLDTPATYHLAYLQALFQAKGLSYTKKYPGQVMELHYLTALIKRCHNTNHLATFKTLLDTWDKLGGRWPQVT